MSTTAKIATKSTKKVTKKANIPVPKFDYDQKVSKTKALKILENNGYKIFNVGFIDKNGDYRNMTCRKGVVKGLAETTSAKSKQVAKTKKALGYMTVYDMIEKSYKTVNLQTIVSLKCGGVISKVG